MSKTMIFGMLVVLLTLTSCMGIGNSVSLSDLEGEWNVVELAGRPVNTKQQPFIGFDTHEMRVYGYGGCNRLMGSFEWSDESARMVMDKLASTMMACPDMAQEKALSHALAQTKKVKQGDTDQILLCDSLDNPLAKLSRRYFLMPLSELQGTWDGRSENERRSFAGFHEEPPFLLTRCNGEDAQWKCRMQPNER